MNTSGSTSWYERARQILPGGVNSPVRSFKGVGGTPLFMARGEGAYLFDVDGNRYIDYVGSWGPLILGHAHPEVVEAIHRAASRGTSFGWATTGEVEMAEVVARLVPSVELLRFVNSGTEATMSAIRLARGYTQRVKVLKFAGCYHGHADAFLSDSPGSGLATLGIPGSLGVPEGAARDTVTVAYNDLAAVRDLFETSGHELAAVIVEPFACNMGFVGPAPEFLPGLRALCDQYGALLIFDEVMTGFRVALGGAQAALGVRPDLTTFGKIIGGGLPVGAYGGRRDIMSLVAPLGGVYQAGTLSGNPLAMAAGRTTLEILARPGVFESVTSRCERLARDMESAAANASFPVRCPTAGSILGIVFTESSLPRNFDELRAAERGRFAPLFWHMLERGVALAPSAFEVGFVSLAHSEHDLAATVEAFREAIAAIRDGVVPNVLSR